jgi:hypothetical protein
MEGTSSADVLNKQYNVIRVVSMTCFEGILLRLGLQGDDDVLLTRSARIQAWKPSRDSPADKYMLRPVIT